MHPLFYAMEYLLTKFSLSYLDVVKGWLRTSSSNVSLYLCGGACAVVCVRWYVCGGTCAVVCVRWCVCRFSIGWERVARLPHQYYSLVWFLSSFVGGNIEFFL